MKFYNKRGNLININSSKTIDEIFYNISKRNIEDIKENYIFIMQEDANLNSFSSDMILTLNIDIVPNASRKRMKFNFENFEDMYYYLKKQNKINTIIPYLGEDLK